MDLIETLADFALGAVLVCAAIFAGLSLTENNAPLSRGVGHGIIWEDDVKWDCETMDTDGCSPADGLIELRTPEDSYIYHA